MNCGSREVFIDREKEMTAWLLRLVVPVKWGEQERVTREWRGPGMNLQKDKWGERGTRISRLDPPFNMQISILFSQSMSKVELFS